TYFAEAGADVVINYRNKAQRAEKLAQELENFPGRVLTIAADLTDSSSVSEMFSRIKTEFGGLDILVLNASGGMEKNMAEDYALLLNRDAQLDVLNHALPLMNDGAR